MRSLTKSQVRAAQKLFGLSDWDIRVITSNDTNGDCLGSTIISFEHKSAAVVLYPQVIDTENIALTGHETLRTILYHELSEIFVAQFLSFLPETWRTTDRMMEYRDAVAEAVSKLVLKLEKPRKEKSKCPTSNPKSQPKKV